MIALPAPDDAAPAATLAAQLREETGAAQGDKAEAACAAVASFCVSELSGETLHRGYLLLLLSRALAAAGEEGAASRVASASGCPAYAAERHPALGRISPDLYRLMSSRCVRPARWSAYPGEIVWTVDFERIRVDSADEGLEVALFAALRRVAGILAAAWSPEGGRTLLALRGNSRRVDEAADSAGRAVRPPLRAMAAFLRDALDVEYGRRGSTARCELVGVDDPPRARRRSSRRSGSRAAVSRAPLPPS
jgi:hypothetical protein